jgi:Mrp family chromosome partitioning ATPase/capsular polysaccharide biosynthesis protein
VVLATVAAAAIWTSTSSKEYAATAKVLVTPLPQDNQSFLGFDLVRDSGDPTRTVQTAAALFESREAADETAKMLGDQTGEQVLSSISVQPEGESNVLDITVTADSPHNAATTANAFTDAVLRMRRETLEHQISKEVDLLESKPASPETTRRLEALNRLDEHGDPTLSLTQSATPSDSPVGASAAIVIGLALLAGLAIGTGTAVVLELTAHRIRDEDEAVELYPLPVLARLPVLPRRARRKAPAGQWPLPPSIREPFRTVTTQLQREAGHKVVLFTSGSTGDGKTTSSINLAMTMALGGHTTILVDTDLRKPGIADSLGLKPPAAASQIGQPIERSLISVPGVEKLWVFVPQVTATDDEALIETFAEHLPRLIEEVSGLAEYVVIDTPPLGEISDALRITPHVDDIVIVVYPGNTNRANYEVMRDLLERSGDQPTGLLLIGDRTGAATTYYGYGMERARRGITASQ